MVFTLNYLCKAKFHGRDDPKRSYTWLFFSFMARVFKNGRQLKSFIVFLPPWVKYLSAIAALLLGIGAVGLAFAPPDYLQGNSYRIIFIHVPTASLAMSIYLAMAVLGDLGMENQNRQFGGASHCPIGFLLCVLSLMTVLSGQSQLGGHTGCGMHA